VDHRLGGLWGQSASQLIQFRNAGDEPWPSWGEIIEAARKDLWVEIRFGVVMNDLPDHHIPFRPHISERGVA
jgi:hypothetical protein